MNAAKLGSLTLGILASLVVTIWAGNDARTTVAFHVAPYQTLSLNGGTAGTRAVSSVQVPDPTGHDLAHGHVDILGAVTLKVRSNAPWVVHVRSLDANMGLSRDGTYTKPLSHFQLRVGDGPYVAVDTADKRLLRGAHGHFAFDVDYRIEFDSETHRDGDYALDLVYTITSR